MSQPSQNRLPSPFTHCKDRKDPVNFGPDGALYIADWLNSVIGHYQASYSDPARDKTHGRIWRIKAKAKPPIEQPNLASMSPGELLDQLRSPERWVRQQSKRLLFNMPSALVLEAADRQFNACKFDSELDERWALEVSGVFAAQESPCPRLVERLLASKNAQIRAYGARLLGTWAEGLPDVLETLRQAITDPHPRVRLEAIVACSYVDKPLSVEVALKALDAPRDRFIDYALAQCVKSLKAQWQPALSSGKLLLGGNTSGDAYLRQISSAEPALPSAGKQLYDNLCLNCHQADARGLPEIYPPLTKNDWVEGDKARLIKILISGLAGPITVNGMEFGAKNSVIIPASSLTDTQIAEVLTYIRSNFGNQASPVHAEEVRDVRSQQQGRTEPWSDATLREK